MNNEAQSREPEPLGKALRVLVVEDHRDTLLVTTRLLKHSGYHADGAETFAEAVAAVRAHHYDVAICDLLLPDGHGLNLLSELRAYRPVKGISLSGLGRAEDFECSRKAGYAFHLTKPIDFATLRDVIEQVASLPDESAGR